MAIDDDHRPGAYRTWSTALVILVQVGLACVVLLDTSYYLSNLFAAGAPLADIGGTALLPLAAAAGVVFELVTIARRRRVAGWVLALVSFLVFAALVWNVATAPF
ncbi:hypothetical protein [Cellulomonas sp. URHD0024]|uniref:hypothetical protein n=1 Tax=Cellulomonas sp. URHD0024 TaxID=1302620 RepID=UPI00054E5039|nr:hypothetical protein [Cellulomonas sp. URHD0024]